MSGGAGVFRSRILIALSGLTLLSGIVIVLLHAFGPTFFDPESSGPSTFSPSALGYRGLYAFLEESGVAVDRARDHRLPRVGAGTALVVTEPEIPDEIEDESPLWEILDGARGRGATIVIVLPKWRGLGTGMQRGWIAGARRLALNDVQKIASVVLRFDEDEHVPVHQAGGDVDGIATAASGKVYQVRLETPHFIPKGQRWEPLLSIRQGMLVGTYRPDDDGPPIVVVVDPDLMNNHGLGDAEHAAAAVELFRNGLRVESVVFDETLHGFDDSGRLVRDALKPPGLVVTAHLLLVLGVAIWAGTGRLGPPRVARPPRAMGREAFIDSTVRLLGGTTDEVSSLGTYWKLAQEVVASELRLPPLPPPERLRRLAEASVARKTQDGPATLDAEISTAIQFETDPKRWVELAGRAHRWRMEMTGGTRSAP